jgi:hypothetical protein
MITDKQLPFAKFAQGNEWGAVGKMETRNAKIGIRKRKTLAEFDRKSPLLRTKRGEDEASSRIWNRSRSNGNEKPHEVKSIK